VAARGARSATVVGPFWGTIIAVPGRGKTTRLVPALRAAGLPASGVTSLDDIRRRLYGRADIFEGAGEVEREARRLEERRMLAGKSVVRDSTGLNAKVRKAEANRAHRYDIRAVAFLSSPLALAELHRRNESRDNPVPRDVVEMFHSKHISVTTADLIAEGFDQVIVWNDLTRFTLL